MGNQPVQTNVRTPLTSAPAAQEQVLAASKLANEIVKAAAQSSRLRITAREV
ncbi:hypothetical protein GCM10027417_26440 [Glutamicibacter endophyticus]